MVSTSDQCMVNCGVFTVHSRYFTDNYSLIECVFLFIICCCVCCLQMLIVSNKNKVILRIDVERGTTEQLIDKVVE